MYVATEAGYLPFFAGQLGLRQLVFICEIGSINSQYFHITGG